MALTTIDLAIYSTKLSNQRTYLAYMRTGLGLAALAGTFKKSWIMMFGISMIIGSSLQYLHTNNQLTMGIDPTNDFFDNFPLFYVLLSISAFYLEFYKK